MRLSDKDLVKELLTSNCSSRTSLPDFRPKVAKDGHVAFIVPGVSASNLNLS